MVKTKIITLDEFVEKALYDKSAGYYAKKNPFGKKGDFITAPGISNLFGEMIAIWIISFWEKQKKPKKFNLIELGPGDGRLCKEVEKIFQKFPEFYESLNIYMYEKSAFLKKIQKKNITSSKVKWINNMGQIKKGVSIFFGNEFFDAIPIKQFIKKDGVLFEKCVQYNGKVNPTFIYKKAPTVMLKKLKDFNLLKRRGVIEFPKQGLNELERIIDIIQKFSGGVLLIDYGYIKPKNKSTIQSVKSHKKNSLLSNIGNADITSLVDFNLIKNFFKSKKLITNNIVSQSFFLQKLGVIERANILASKMSFKDKSDLYFRLERLLGEKFMGKLFKVIFAYKTKEKNLLGFK